MHSIRPSAFAGTFYPLSKQSLKYEVETLLAMVGSASCAAIPKALIVPHAGYVYSGRTAAFAYASLSALKNMIKRVVLLGPVHRVAVRGLALPSVEYFETPLGQIELDTEAISLISNMMQVKVSAAAHAQEHSIEVQLPFLQTVLGNFKLVPLAVGDATPDEVDAVLDKLWGGTDTLIIISSDLSHFLPYHVAQTVDRQTVQSILELQGIITHDQACGSTPINGFVMSAKRHHLRPQLLDYRNSGDTAGDKSRVVGYASFAFMEDELPHAHRF